MTQPLIELFERDLAKLKTEVELTNDRDLWQTREGVTNSIGNLTLHLCGNLKHFVGAILGETGYIREREREFSDKNVSKADLYANLGETREVVISTLQKLTQEQLNATYPKKVFDKDMTGMQFLIHLHSHLNYHLGQINYLRRILS